MSQILQNKAKDFSFCVNFGRQQLPFAWYYEEIMTSLTVVEPAFYDHRVLRPAVIYGRTLCYQFNF